jgi:hypothetical protein
MQSPPFRRADVELNPGIYTDILTIGPIFADSWYLHPCRFDSTLHMSLLRR